MPEAAADHKQASSRWGDLREFVLALFHQWQALIVGFAFSFALAVVPATLGEDVPPWLWGLALGLAVLPASFLAWRSERGRVEQLEGEFRARKRAAEAKDFNVPRVFQRGSLTRAALVARAQTPLGLLPESNAELDRLVGKAIANPDRDSLYIIKREMLAKTFGPFEGQQGGKYGRLPWEDARAEIAKLELHGLIERVTAAAPPICFRWTPFGYAVIGKLGPKLQ
jgi:hypothetical protein